MKLSTFLASGAAAGMLLITDLPGAGTPRVTVASGRQPETSDFTFDVPSRRCVDGFQIADISARPIPAGTG
jgi:hypothetical protein